MSTSTYFQIIGALTSSKRIDHDYSAFDLTLDHEVTVTESFYPAFSPLSFITMMGGALGLWLGVGAVQLVAYLVSTVSWINLNGPTIFNKNK